MSTTPTEHWQKTSDIRKGKKLPTNLGRANEKKEKNRDKGIGTGPAPVGRSCEGGKEDFPPAETVDGRGGKLWSDGGECSNRGVEGKAETFPHRGSVLTNTHQPERLVCSPARVGR